MDADRCGPAFVGLRRGKDTGLESPVNPQVGKPALRARRERNSPAGPAFAKVSAGQAPALPGACAFRSRSIAAIEAQIDFAEKLTVMFSEEVVVVIV